VRTCDEATECLKTGKKSIVNKRIKANHIGCIESAFESTESELHGYEVVVSKDQSVMTDKSHDESNCCDSNSRIPPKQDSLVDEMGVPNHLKGMIDRNHISAIRRGKGDERSLWGHVNTKTSGVMINHQDDTVDRHRENKNILCDAEQSDSKVTKVIQVVENIDRKGDSILKYTERGDDGVPSSGKCRTIETN